MSRIATPRSPVAAVLPLLLPLLVACEDGPAGDPADTGTIDEQDGSEVEDALDHGDGACTLDLGEVEPEDQVALLHESGALFYNAVVGGDVMFPPADILQFELWPDRGGPAGTGTWSVEAAPYADCGLCMLLRQGCEPVEGITRCERDFLATQGTVEIEAFGVLGETISGTISGVILVETIIDWDSGSFESSPVAGGQGACLDLLAYEAYLTEYPVR